MEALMDCTNSGGPRKRKWEAKVSARGSDQNGRKHVTGTSKPTISTVKNRKLRKGKKLERGVECTLCDKVISERRNLNRHLRSIHGIQPKVRNLRVKCSFSDTCSFVCATSTILRKHLETIHDFSIVQKNFHFDSRSDFDNWKEEEEIRTCASYVTDTGVKHRNKKKICYLRCHRSGFTRKRENCEKGKVRSKPVRGYTQCGLTCPSSMRFVESQNGKIDVCYFPKHLGHETDDESIRYIKLRRKEKEEIAAKLVQGEPISKIVCDARTNRGQKLSRINFLQRRDVYNIKSKVTFLEKEVDQDGIDIDIWISQLNLNSLNNYPIALYKPIDENNDYMLVIIHHIQKITYSLLFDGSMVYIKAKKGNANVDFNLTVLYMVNENGDGYPLAFCISSKSDYSTILEFFKVVSDAYGLITAQIFISDNIKYYYVAWKNVMGECENKLICNFNIYMHWDQKLLELNCPVKKHDTVSTKLKSLLNEMDPDVFDSELVRLLNSWSEDDDLKSFVKFFYKYYCRKPFEWANCYRIHSVRKENINNYLEPLHEQVERAYAEGAKNMQNGLHFIFLLIRRECYFNLAKWDEDILAENVKEIKRNHEASGNVTDVSFNGREWVIRQSEMIYKVIKDDSDCGKNCGIICFNCDICIHNFRCSCSDYVTNFSICIHIHAVVTRNKSKPLDMKLGDSKKCLASSALQFSAVTLSKTVTEYLEKSNLTDLEYDKVILDLDKFIKQHSLKEKFEYACFRRALHGGNS